jgi:hypothetical protein
LNDRNKELKAFALTAALPLIEFIAARTVRRLKMRRWRKSLRADFAKHMAQPVAGPDSHDVPATWVDSVEQYVELCRDLESSAPESETAVYRGQSREFYLGSTRQISLLPCVARPPRKPTAHTWRMEQAYRKYLKAVVRRHIDRLAETREEKFFFLEMINRHGLARTAEGRFLASTPQGRFLRAIYPAMPNPWLLEAALQHYGFPTFALDATRSPLVALYFALHSFTRGIHRMLKPVPGNEPGVVYVLFIPKKTPYRRGIVEWPRLVDLYDQTLDNFSRPRRQFAVTLPEAGYIGLADTPQANVYSSFIRRVIRFSPRFRSSPGFREFIDAGLGAWLFPSTKVDLLHRKLRSASPRRFPIYEAGGSGASPRLEDQFEFTRPRRIILTGSDAGNVKAVLCTTWHARLGWVEELPLEEVMRLASISGGPETLDIVVACEPFLWQSERLHEMIHDAGFRHGRLFVVFGTGVVGDVLPRHMARITDIGGVPYITTNDLYDSDYSLQNMMFDAQIELSRVRYERRMKPGPDDWRSILERAQAGEAP